MFFIESYDMNSKMLSKIILDFFFCIIYELLYGTIINLDHISIYFNEQVNIIFGFDIFTPPSPVLGDGPS